MDQVISQRIKRSKRWFVFIVSVLIFLFAALISVIVIVPAISPSIGAQAADLIRSVVGPQPVADLETISFRLQDVINKYRSSTDGGQPQISFDQKTNTQPTVHILARVIRASTPANTIPPVNAVVTAPPQIGWQAYGPTVNGESVMARTMVALDPNRPYTGIALVRIDLSKLKLHMMPGFLEPSHSTQVIQALPNLGIIPAIDQSNLIAAFNGGFKAVNGQYGMMVNGVTLLQPIPGIATIAIYKDGHIEIGAWGQDIHPGPDMVAYRQNCPLIVANGQLNSQVSLDNRTMWGQTVGNKEITWRTAIGLTQDGRYLIYAIGNGTTVETLANALRNAGAYTAMQLDINRHYAHFVTYQPGKTNGSLNISMLLDQMESDPTLYLTAHSRDFFYLTSR